MRRISFARFVIFLMLCTSCSTARHVASYDFSDELSKNEGVVVMRIHNETAGGSAVLQMNESPSSIREFPLCSDITLRPSIGLDEYIISNSENPVQLVCMILPAGTWHLTGVGENSDYTYSEHYQFTVQPGVVNYVGEWNLRLYPSINYFGIHDMYSISVTDSFDETIRLLQDVHPKLSVYDIVDACNEMPRHYPKGWEDKMMEFDSLHSEDNYLNIFAEKP